MRSGACSCRDPVRGLSRRSIRVIPGLRGGCDGLLNRSATGANRRPRHTAGSSAVGPASWFGRTSPPVLRGSRTIIVAAGAARWELLMDGQWLADRVRAAYRAFAAGDPDLYRAAFSPNVVWHVPG